MGTYERQRSGELEGEIQGFLPLFFWRKASSMVTQKCQQNKREAHYQLSSAHYLISSVSYF